MCLASANCHTGGAERTGGAAANRRSHPSHPTGTRWSGCGDHHHRQLRAVRSKKGERILMETMSNLLTQAEKREEQLSRVLEKIYSAAQPGAVYSEPVTAGTYTIITIGPDGVTVKPVVDVTKIALAGVTAWGTMLMLLRRMRKASKR